MAPTLSYILEVQGEAEAVGDVEKFSDSIDRADQTAQKATKSTVSLGQSVTQAGLGLSAAASGAFALYTQYDNLEKMELRVERAAYSLTTAKATLASSEATLNSMIEKGITAGPRYESVVLRMQAAQENLAVQTQNLSLAQGDLTQGQMGFALTVMPTVFGAVQGVTSAMTALRAIQASSTAAHAAAVPATTADAGSKVALAGAAGSAAAGVGGLTLATRLFQIAIGPVGWVILGVSTLMALFATNAFGVRDAINAAGKAIGDAVPVLRPLLDALSSLANMIFPEAEQSASDYELQMEMASGANAGFTESVQVLGVGIGKASAELKTYNDWLVETEQATINSTAENLYYLQSIGEIENLQALTNEQINLAAGFLQEQAVETQRVTKDNFSLVASYEGLDAALAMSNEELARWADGLRSLEERALDAEEAIDKLQRKAGGSVAERAIAAGLVGKDAKLVSERPGRASFIERHATGGLITEPTIMIGTQTGQFGIAGENGTETILPMTGANRGGPAASIGGGGPTIINVNLDGRNIAKYLADEHGDTLRLV